MDFNKVVLTGRITAEPELKTSGEKEFMNFSLAVNRYGKDAAADFFKVVVFGKTAEFISKYIHKGDLLLIEGRLSTSSWVDNNGVKKYSTDILSNSVMLMRRKNENSQSEKNVQDKDSDEIPF